MTTDEEDASGHRPTTKIKSRRLVEYGRNLYSASLFILSQ